MKRRVPSLMAYSAGLLAAAPALAQTVPSELCTDAPAVGLGSFQYSAPGADKDGVSTCGEGLNITDRWVTYAPAASGPATITLSGPCTAIVSVQSGCPGTAANTIACNVGALNPAQVSFAATGGSVYRVRLVNVASCAGPWTVSLSGPPTTGGFTYQGRLKQNGSAVSGPADLKFSLWTLASGGVQIGGVDALDNVPVSDGLFTVRLNDSQEFGADPFGGPCWLRVEVRSPAGAGNYTTLSPRQLISPTPLASLASRAYALSAPDGDPANAVFVDGAGDVGIGTTNPLVPLHIAPAAGLAIGQSLSSGGSTALRLRLTEPTGGVAVIEAIESAGSTFGDLILNPAGGNVGIGTMTPAFTLAVNGTAAKAGGGSWSVLSDGRLKSNVAPLTGTLDRLLRLRGVTFEYNEEGLRTDLAQPGVHTGLIAQEVERVFPEWVGESPDGHKFITEQGVTALLVEALRDLRREKDADIADLRERLERLEAAVERR